MGKQKLNILASLCFAAAVVMYAVGSSDGKLTELKDFFWVPIPLGLLCTIAALRKKYGEVFVYLGERHHFFIFHVVSDRT